MTEKNEPVDNDNDKQSAQHCGPDSPNEADDAVGLFSGEVNNTARAKVPPSQSNKGSRKKKWVEPSIELIENWEQRKR